MLVAAPCSAIDGPASSSSIARAAWAPVGLPGGPQVRHDDTADGVDEPAPDGPVVGAQIRQPHEHPRGQSSDPPLAVAPHDPDVDLDRGLRRLEPPAGGQPAQRRAADAHGARQALGVDRGRVDGVELLVEHGDPDPVVPAGGLGREEAAGGAVAVRAAARGVDEAADEVDASALVVRST